MHKRKVILFKTIWRRSCPAFLQESSSRAWNANFATWHQQHFKQYIVDLMKFNTFKWIYLVLQTRGISKTDVFFSQQTQPKQTYLPLQNINKWKALCFFFNTESTDKFRWSNPHSLKSVSHNLW